MGAKEKLLKAASKDAAIRTSLELQPAGGPGTKAFPPTYDGPANRAVYATEERKLEDGSVAKCVLLDSVQSQANRMEEALLKAVRNDSIELPIIQADFTGKYPDIGKITTLDAPHRIADAVFRESNYDGTPFRDTEYGKAFENSSMEDASQLYRICPTALLFGAWDSTGQSGAQFGTKFPRAITSEIVGIEVTEGVDPSGRISPLDITGSEDRVYEKPSGQITHDEEEAADDSDKMSPSEVNLGNVTPSYHPEGASSQDDTDPGGVTMERAELTTVISLSGLRRLSFPKDGETDTDRDQAARASLAALGVAATALQYKHGYSLRSRCNLVPQEPLSFEIVHKDGQTEELDVSASEAADVFNQTHEAAAEEGLGWEFETFDLEPTEDLMEEIENSRVQTQQN